MASILGMNTYAGIVPTTVTGATNYNPIGYVGEYSTEEAVSGGDVSIEADAAGEDLSFMNVLGGFTSGEGATASENSVYMAGGCVADLYGADACGDASQNSIIMAGGQAESLFGANSSYANAFANSISISGGTVSGVASGAHAVSGESFKNSISMSGGVASELHGGSTNLRDAHENDVYMNGGWTQMVYGGFSLLASAYGNGTTITNGVVGGNVYAGFAAQEGEAHENVATVTGGTVQGSVTGGYSKEGEAYNNLAQITAGTVQGTEYYSVAGGASDTNNANENAVVMTGGTVFTSVLGGWSRLGNTERNEVHIMGGTETAEDNFFVCGGYTANGSSIGNMVEISGGTLLVTVFGGSTVGGEVCDNIIVMSNGIAKSLQGGSSLGADVKDNTVYLDGGQVYGFIAGGVGTYEGLLVSGNKVEMTAGHVGASVIGGSSGGGDVEDNIAVVSGGVVGGDLTGGVSFDGTVKNNTAVLLGGTIDMELIGGLSQQSDACGNTVVVAGGTASDNVSGGQALEGGNASGNSVHLVGEGASYSLGGTAYQGGKVAIKGSVYAGFAGVGGSDNNSVRVYGTGINIGGSIDYSQQLNFHLVQGQAAAPSTPMVTLGGALDLEGVELGFNGDAVTDWAAFNGKSITLVSMTNETITGLLTPTDSVDITDEAGKTVATATLTLSDEGKALTLTNIQGVGPVPTAGPDALDVALANSLWASSAYVREFVRLSEGQGYVLKDGDTSVWGGGFGTFMHTTGDRGFKSNGGGYGIGVNHAFSANTQAGISFGQGFGSYHNSGEDGATVHQRAILAAATASTRIGKNLSLGGHLAFGNVRNRADCRLEGESGRARWNDNVFNLGAQAAYDFHVTEATAITPFLGLDWAYGAQESVNGAYGRHYSHGRLNELRMPVGVTVSTSAEVGSTKLLPQLSVAYVPSLAQQVPHANVSSENGNYRVKGYAPGRNAFMLNVGVNAVFSDSWSAGASYTLETRSRSVDQSVNASVRYTF